jgi:hypothetical protein
VYGTFFVAGRIISRIGVPKVMVAGRGLVALPGESEVPW